MEIASLVKPGTGVTLAYSGLPWSLSETAAMKGTLFSEPRPGLPPARSPPRCASSTCTLMIGACLGLYRKFKSSGWL